MQFRAVRTPSTPSCTGPRVQGRFPAVVALHGCDGVVTGSGKVGANYADWGGRLADAGFVVLFPDSFGSRGLGSQCRAGDRKVRAFVERVDDAAVARRWLQRQPYIIKDRVSLLGWSNGGNRNAVGGAAKENAARRPAGFPLGGCLLSGLRHRR